MDLSSLRYTEEKYGEHDLQRVGIWEFPEDVPREKSGYWVVYIHGGAWRDPRQLLYCFEPSVRASLPGSATSAESGPNMAISGFASIDYRLSPHPEFPQDPTTTPPNSFRSALHPDHILDVRAGISLLQRKFGFDSRYILLGHSAGATLAYQLFMGADALGGRDRAPEDLVLPAAVVGLAGIYEVTAFNQRHGGGCAGFLKSAFGDDEKLWDRDMPAYFQGSFGDALGPSRAYLYWSPEDKLVDEPEIDVMTARLERDGVDFKASKSLKGEHDFVWEDGRQIVALVEDVLSDLQKA